MKNNKLKGISLATKKQTTGEEVIKAYNLGSANYGFEVGKDVQFIMSSLRIYERRNGEGFYLYVVDDNEDPPSGDYVIECGESFKIPNFNIKCHIDTEGNVDKS